MTLEALPHEIVGPCFLCGEPGCYAPDAEGGAPTRFRCERCGQFKLEGDFRGLASGTDALPARRRERLRSFIARRRITLLHRLDLEDPVRIGLRPLDQSAQDKVDRVLEHLARESTELGDSVGTPTLAALGGDLSEQELTFCLNLLEEQKLVLYAPTVESSESGSHSKGIQIDGWQVTAAGWSRVDAIRARSPTGRQALVAMWFDDALKHVWDEGFCPALTSSGYEPIRLDYVEHVSFVPDEILAAIRRARLVVADFTGQRGGVYFEAGFAMGLGKPVICTVQKEALDGVHFDLRQFNHIVWENPLDLAARLSKRIAALFPL